MLSWAAFCAQKMKGTMKLVISGKVAHFDGGYENF